MKIFFRKYENFENLLKYGTMIFIGVSIIHVPSKDVNESRKKFSCSRITLTPHPYRQEGYRYVLPCVCLSVCRQHRIKSNDRIFVKILSRVAFFGQGSPVLCWNSSGAEVLIRIRTPDSYRIALAKVCVFRARLVILVLVVG